MNYLGLERIKIRKKRRTEREYFCGSGNVFFESNKIVDHIRDTPGRGIKPLGSESSSGRNFKDRLLNYLSSHSNQTVWSHFCPEAERRRINTSIIIIISFFFEYLPMRSKWSNCRWNSCDVYEKKLTKCGRASFEFVLFLA